MGDHRASIKIKFECHGIKRKADMWINWFPLSEFEHVDRRIIEFFSNAWADAHEKYRDGMQKYHNDEEEKKEREMYERLKEKFGASR